MMTLFPYWSRTWPLLLLLALTVCTGVVSADPPSRVARLSVLHGDVSFAPAGEDSWYAANLNRPLTSGDRLDTDSGARAELDLGMATVRLDERSSFGLRALDDRNVQLELTQGTVNLRVHDLSDEQRIEVDTPTLVFVVSQPGEYRIDIEANGASTRVTLFDGAGEVFGDAGTRYRVSPRQSYRFDDSRLRAVAVEDLARPDAFDNWCFARDDRYDSSQSRRYLPDGVVGGAGLDDYGAWNDGTEYGPIWYPTRVASGWAPYRDGHWAWIDPWGWTWVDNAPWGFAPFHYGRWVYVGNRWGWLPGPIAQRPVYAPALVVFIGGGSWSGGHARGTAPVGWYPLGPRDIYRPPYSVSRGYYTRINTGNSRLLDRNHVGGSYEAYEHGRAGRDDDSAYRHNPAAVTRASGKDFVHPRPVAANRPQLNREPPAHDRSSRDAAPPVPAARLRAIERNDGRASTDHDRRRFNDLQPVPTRDQARPRVRVNGPPQAPDSPAPPSRETTRRFTPPHERNAERDGVEHAPGRRDTSPVEPDRAQERPARRHNQKEMGTEVRRERGSAAPVPAAMPQQQAAIPAPIPRAERRAAPHERASAPREQAREPRQRNARRGEGKAHEARDGGVSEH